MIAVLSRVLWVGCQVAAGPAFDALDEQEEDALFALAALASREAEQPAEDREDQPARKKVGHPPGLLRPGPVPHARCWRRRSARGAPCRGITLPAAWRGALCDALGRRPGPAGRH